MLKKIWGFLVNALLQLLLAYMSSVPSPPVLSPSKTNFWVQMAINVVLLVLFLVVVSQGYFTSTPIVVKLHRIHNTPVSIVSKASQAFIVILLVHASGPYVGTGHIKAGIVDEVWSTFLSPCCSRSVKRAVARVVNTI